MPPGRHRLWLASELMYPELTSTGYYVSAIARAMAERASVDVVCAQPTYAARGTRAPAEEAWEGVTIRRVRGTTFDKNRLAGRLLNMLSFSVSALAVLLRRVRSGDVVLVLTNPPTLPLLAAVACAWRGARLVVLVHDLYPDTLVAVTTATERALVVRAWRRVTAWLFARASHIVVVGRDMARRLASHHPDVEARIVVIPNWGETGTIRPCATAGRALRAEHGLDGRFVVMYAGNLGRPNDLESLVEAAARLRADGRFRFVFVGSGAKVPWLQTTVRTRGLDSIVLLGPRPRAEQEAFLNACDLAVVPFVGGMWGAAVPSRLYNFMAAGKPIVGIVEPGSEVDLVITETGTGWVTPPHDAEALVTVLLDAASDPARLQAMGARARAAAETAYDGRASLAAYAALLEPLLDAGPAQ
ncbi:MAG: glycosyltransferase family 4 protein [Vicinamibacterales bacterium]